MIDTIKKFTVEFFSHKRMKALYWSVGAMGFSVAGGVFTEMLPQFGVKESIVLFVGLVIAQITKALNSKIK